MMYNGWGWIYFAGYTVVDLIFGLIIGIALSGLIVLCGVYSAYCGKKFNFGFHGLKIRMLQNQILSRGDYRYQLLQGLEEIKELEEEIEMFLYIHAGCEITKDDLCRPCGNLHKEIEDVINIAGQFRKMFNQTPEQKAHSRGCRKTIAQQMKTFLERTEGL